MSDTDQGRDAPWDDETKKDAPVEREEPVEEKSVEEKPERDTVPKLLEEMFVYLSDRMERTTQRQPHDHGQMTRLVQRLRAIE